MKVYIFDLDHTVIDSSHRQMTDAQGNLDLAHWFENATPDKIFQDSLLPLADHMKRVFVMSYVVVCTARTMSQADHDYLAHHGLYHDAILSRGPGDMSGDGALKLRLLTEFFERTDLDPADAVFYEDNMNVHQALGQCPSLGKIEMVHPDFWHGVQ